MAVPPSDYTLDGRCIRARHRTRPKQRPLMGDLPSFRPGPDDPGHTCDVGDQLSDF